MHQKTGLLSALVLQKPCILMHGPVLSYLFQLMQLGVMRHVPLKYDVVTSNCILKHIQRIQSHIFL